MRLTQNKVQSDIEFGTSSMGHTAKYMHHLFDGNMMDEIKAKVHHHRDKLSVLTYDLKLDTKAMVLRLRWLLIARERKIVPRSQSFESFCHSHTRE
ncbi:hypothetical protein P8452_48747 [Trifolium repens]|nr:hypothetical protein P8452_48747 [Trifolium repens]